MVILLNPQLTDRFVKVRADLGEQPDGVRYHHSTGFVVREGVVLTSAHGVDRARSIRITDLHQDFHDVDPDSASLWSGDPAGPAADKAPDLAVLSVPGLGPGLRPFPIARLNRSSPNLATLRDVQVFGFPAFAETSRRNSFQDTGRIPLQSLVESGLVEVGLPTSPRDLDPGSDIRSQWSGISGAPVIVDGRLVALVTEHSPPAGPSRLSATPLSLLDPDPRWPEWGPGVSDPAAWWARLGVDDPARLPALPAESVPSEWIDDLRALAEELEELTSEDLPRAARKPASFAVQAHEALLAAFGDLTEPDFDEAARRLQQIVTAPDSASSVYGVTTGEALTSQRLIAVLDQLLVVHRQAATWLHSSLPRLSYRVAAPHLGFDDLALEIERWVQQQSPDDGEARQVVSRLEVTTATDAYGELLACLSNAEWNESDPADSVRRLVDFMFSEDLGTPDAADKIEHCFPRRAPAAASMFTRADTEPERVVRDERGFLVNEQPTLHHLRHGYFAPAEELDQVEDAYWSWYQQEVVADFSRRGGRVPTFWLTGPSGAGKSILLLQLLARLNTRAGVSVLLLESAGDQLGRTTEQALSLSRDRHVIVGVDDPMLLTYQGGAPGWRSAFDILGHRRQADGPGLLPIFVCCAPTEHYDRFRQMYAGVVQIERCILDPYRPEFTSQLRHWYQERTGKAAQASTADGTPLPAQLFFEWWVGEGIETFARHFRNRITARSLAELTEFFDRLLAVNRLYLGYPPEAVDALTPQARDALQQFQRDMHVDRQPTVRRSGYWLSHPHLANLIYNEWFPEDSHYDQRGAHLTAALLDAVRIGEQGWASLPLIEQLVAALDPGGIPAADSRTHTEQIRRALTVGAAVVAPAAAALAHPVLASWVKVERRLPYGLDGWSPLDDALARLRGASLAELALKVLVVTLAELGDAAADEAVWDFLEAHPQWAEWTSTTALLVARPLAQARPLTRARVQTLAAGIMARLDEADALDLLGAALQRQPADPVLLSLAHQLVEGHLASAASLAPLAAVLFSIGGKSEQVALTWLAAEVRQENGLVFAAIMRRRLMSARAWDGLAKWLVAYPLEEAAGSGFARVANWNRVADKSFQNALGRHLRRRGEFISPELIASLRGLLGRDNGSWSYLFALLTPAQVRKPEIRSAALAWLRRNADSTAWPGVYVHLCRAVYPPDPELTQVGRDRLPSVWAHPYCSHILVSMLRVCADQDRPTLARKALSWMKAYPDGDGWGFLASPVIQSTAPGEVEKVAADIIAWLPGHRDVLGASYVLRAVLAAPTSAALRSEAVRHAQAWLGVPHDGWGHVFLDVLPLISDDVAAALALPWLTRHLADDRWAAVLNEMTHRLAASQVAEFARAWFSQPTSVQSDSQAGFMWRIVLEEGPCRELLYDAAFRKVINAWLAVHGQLKSWWHIWRETYKAEPTDMDTLRAALTADLRNQRGHGVGNLLRRTVAARPELAEPTWEVMRASPQTESWRLTWIGLSLAAPTPACWELGLSHLNGLPPEQFSGSWRRLWNAFPDEPERRTLRLMAREWLTSNPDPDGKIQAKLDEDAAQRITPATIFGVRRPKVPRVLVGTVRIDLPPASPGPSVARAGLELACPQCGKAIEFPAPVPGQVPAQGRRYICTDCDASLAVDTRAGTVTLLGIFQRRPAQAVTFSSKDIRQARAIVHCDQCGRDLRAMIRTPTAHLAADDQCGYLHEVRIELLEAWLARVVGAPDPEGKGPR